MEFTSFEEALQLCVVLEDGSPEQREAMIYCIEHAPTDLRTMLIKRLNLAEDDNCSCGCNKVKG